MFTIWTYADLTVGTINATAVNAGTVTNAPSASGSYNPTNNSDNVTPDYWVYANDVSSSPVSSWPDRTTNGINLSAATTERPALITSGLNGLNYIAFDGTQNRMKNTVYQQAQPNEIVFVAAFTNTGNTFFFDCTNGSAAHYYGLIGNAYRISGGSQQDVGIFVTNKWMVLDVVFNDASSAIYTNNVSVGSISALGTNPQSGIEIGTGIDVFFGNVAFAEILGYKAVLGTTARLNLFNYLTNKYVLPP
jgi:hypothetical protein